MNKEELLAFARDMGVDEEKALAWYDNRNRNLFGEIANSQAGKQIKKSKNPYFAEMRSIFFEFIEKEKFIGYSWRAKDAVGINEITKKLLKLKEEYKDENTIGDIFRLILQNLKEADKFTYENISVGLLNSRLHLIIPKLMKGNNNDYKRELKNKLNL